MSLEFWGLVSGPVIIIRHFSSMERRTFPSPLLKHVRIVPLSAAHLEQTGNLASLGVQVDVVETGSGSQTRHGGHVADQGVDEFRTSGQSNSVDGQGESSGDTLLVGVIRQGQSGLGHTDGEMSVA